jgi:predicted nucleotidyltransferase
MAGEQVVFHDGRYNGRTLKEWLPELVEAIRETFDPIQIILFGSVAAGREHRDSDIDLLIVLPEVENKHDIMVAVLEATADIPVPLDVIPTDPEEIRRRGNRIGSVLRPALRDGTVLFERAA